MEDIIFFENVQVEECVDLAKENENHADWNNDLHADGEEKIELACAALINFVQKSFELDLATYHDTHKQCTQMHGNAFGESVHKVEPAIVELADYTKGFPEEKPHSVGTLTIK